MRLPHRHHPVVLTHHIPRTTLLAPLTLRLPTMRDQDHVTTTAVTDTDPVDLEARAPSDVAAAADVEVLVADTALRTAAHPRHLSVPLSICDP